MPATRSHFKQIWESAVALCFSAIWCSLSIHSPSLQTWPRRGKGTGMGTGYELMFTVYLSYLQQVGDKPQGSLAPILQATPPTVFFQFSKGRVLCQTVVEFWIVAVEAAWNEPPLMGVHLLRPPCFGRFLQVSPSPALLHQ